MAAGQCCERSRPSTLRCSPGFKAEPDRDPGRSDAMSAMTKLRSLTALLAQLASTCAELEKEKLPVVATVGPHAVTAGKTIALTASTTNGSDPAYAWQSSAPAVASV